MKESEATPGTKLHALVIACQMGTTLATQLRKMERQSGPDWNELMLSLQRGLVEGIRRNRFGGREDGCSR